MSPRTVLHLGAHKTATTHLQQTLHAHRRFLAEAGVLCLLPADLRGPALRLGRLPAGGTEQGTLLRGRLAEAADVLISEENVLGTAHEGAMLEQGLFYPEGRIRLENVLKASGPARLCLAVRDPAGFLVSAYSQRLFSGVICRFDEFLGGCSPERMRWSELVARLVTAAGAQGCTVWRFEDWPRVAPLVLGAMLPAPVAAQIDLVEAVAHPGLSRRAYEWVMDERRAGRTAPDVAQRARRRFPKQRGDAPLQLFSDAVMRASAEAYASDLEVVQRMPGVTLLRATPAEA